MAVAADAAAGAGARRRGGTLGALRANALHYRTHHGHRLALHAGNLDEALARLAEFREGKASLEYAIGRAPASGVHRWPGSTLATARSVGHGPRDAGRRRHLPRRGPRGRRDLPAAVRWSLVDELMRDAQTSRMALTEVAQPTLFALQVGVTTVLREADCLRRHDRSQRRRGRRRLGQRCAEPGAATLVIHQRSLAQSATAAWQDGGAGIGADEARAAMAAVGGFQELAGDQRAVGGSRVAAIRSSSSSCASGWSTPASSPACWRWTIRSTRRRWT